MRRFAAVVFAAMLSAGSGGCVILMPPIPMDAVGYGHTYAVVNQDGNPLNEGFLLLESECAGEAMYNCYDVKDGRAEVPFKVAYRAGCGPYSDNVPPLWFTWSNPHGTRISPLVPGYVPDGPPEDWEKRFRVLSPVPWDWWGLVLLRAPSGWDDWPSLVWKPPPDIRLVKADRETEMRYLQHHQYISPSNSWATIPPGYSASDRQADDAAKRRLADYVAARLKELGYKPESNDWGR